MKISAIYVGVLGLIALGAGSSRADTAVLEAQLSPEQIAIKTQPIYPTVNVRWLITAADPARHVIYFTTPEQREQRRIIVVGGYVYDHTGVPFTYTNNNGDEMNYVMDAEGNFYWLDESTDPTIRHDSIFDMGPVAGGGNITIINSKITYIDADSGHYPTGPVFKNTLAELAKDGTDLSTIKAVDTDNDDPIFHKPSKSNNPQGD
jgi:hypothetical protein